MVWEDCQKALGGRLDGLGRTARWALEDGRTIAQLATKHHCELAPGRTPCIPIVGVIAELMHRGAWTWLIGLSPTRSDVKTESKTRNSQIPAHPRQLFVFYPAAQLQL